MASNGAGAEALFGMGLPPWMVRSTGRLNKPRGCASNSAVMTNQTSLSDPFLRDLLRLDAVWSAVSRVFDRALSGTGVSLPQALALTTIESAPQPLLLSGLAARLLQE